MKLSKVAQLAIREDRAVREFIMGMHNISRQTLYNWKEQNDERLLDERVLKFIANKLEVKQSILTIK